jgi:hypothetical protein
MGKIKFAYPRHKLEYQRRELEGPGSCCGTDDRRSVPRQISRDVGGISSGNGMFRKGKHLHSTRKLTRLQSMLKAEKVAVPVNIYTQCLRNKGLNS